MPPGLRIPASDALQLRVAKTSHRVDCPGVRRADSGTWRRAAFQEKRGEIMSANAETATGLLSRARTVARPGFNRWLVPPCALAIHLCIGMAYGFSVFWLPLSKSIGITKSVSCPKDMDFLTSLTQTSCDWKVADLATTFTIFIVVLGIAAA